MMMCILSENKRGGLQSLGRKNLDKKEVSVKAHPPFTTGKGKRLEPISTPCQNSKGTSNVHRTYWGRARGGVGKLNETQKTVSKLGLKKKKKNPWMTG